MKIRPATFKVSRSTYVLRSFFCAVDLNGFSAFLFHVVNKMLLNLSHTFFKGEHGSAVRAGTTTDPHWKRN